MVGDIVLVLFFVFAPAGVMWLCSRVKWLGKIGPVLILYALGLIVGNVVHTPGQADIQDIMSSATVPLAIPLMLFSFRYMKGQTRSQMLSLITGVVAVVAAVIAGFLIFGRNIEEGAKVGGMLTGVYTGGTVNLAALKTMLGASDEMFLLLNGYDMVVSFVYLAFLLIAGIGLFRRFLPVKSLNAGAGESTFQAMDSEVSKGNPFKGILSRDGLKDAGLQIGLCVLILGISAGLGLLAGDGLFMTVLILSLTTMGIAASFLKRVRRAKYGYDMGMYLIYIFCIVVASMADFSKMDLEGGLNALGYLTFVIFGSLLLQVILAKIFKIDSDTMVVSSVAFICSPPFVPMMTAAMKNRNVLAPGLAIGVIGYAIGNYLGFLMYKLLPLL
ncbi:MAG: DUF819 family protein [Bacteroidales bacterium]|nr:DUF819 family protein [Bacteroidales bacterium]